MITDGDSYTKHTLLEAVIRSKTANSKNYHYYQSVAAMTRCKLVALSSFPRCNTLH